MISEGRARLTLAPVRTSQRTFDQVSPSYATLNSPWALSTMPDADPCVSTEGKLPEIGDHRSRAFGGYGHPTNGPRHSGIRLMYENRSCLQVTFFDPRGTPH